MRASANVSEHVFEFGKVCGWVRGWVGGWVRGPKMKAADRCQAR
jgi:hypothetical protein